MDLRQGVIKREQAFSLVELSIVLVIIGLLVGAILAGQSLIRASELRSITADFQRFDTAITAFHDKYSALPGDMKDATRYWGFAGTGSCKTNSGAAVVTPGTCDGNGDSKISYGPAAGDTGEAFRAWQQLANAGLIEGSYTGNAGPLLNSDYQFGSNSPRSKISSIGWMITYIDNTAAAATYMYSNDYTNWLGIGGDTTAGTYADDGFLKPEEAWNIDTKLDDGNPATGGVQAWPFLLCTTSTVNTDRTGTYNLGNTSPVCALGFQY